MITLTLIIAVGAVALGFSTWTRLPAAAFGVVAGILLRASGAPLDELLVQEGLFLAMTFLVFAVGAEIDRRHVMGFRKLAWIVAVLQFAIVAAVAVPLGIILELETWTIVYLTLALAAGSTFLVTDLMRRRERFFEPIGRLVVGVSLAQDLVVVVLLALLAVSLLEGEEAWYSLAALAVLPVAAWICTRWLAPIALLRFQFDEEEMLLFVLAVLFLFIGFCFAMDLPLIVGAFFAGAAFSRFPTSGLIRGHLTSFSDFFLILFYVVLGTVIAVPRPTELFAELAFVVALLLIRPALLFPVTRRAMLTVRSSFEAATLFAPVGELGLVVALVGVENGRIGEDVLGLIVAVVVATMLTVPALSSDRTTWKLTRWYPLGPSAPPSSRDDHVILIGCGEGGRAILERLKASHVDVVVIDVEPSVIAELERDGIPVVRGDGTAADILEAAGVRTARVIVSTMRRLHDNTQLLNLRDDVPVIVRIFSEDEAAAIRKQDGHPVIESEAAAEAFFAWYHTRFDGPTSDESGPVGEATKGG